MRKDRPERKESEVIGLIPAGGQAKRLSPLPCSKELYPIGFERTDAAATERPKAVCEYLLERMRQAGIERVYIVLRQGKWDIPAYLRDGAMLDMHIAYLMMNLPFGAPYTLDQAYPFVRDSLVALGFPDILFGTENGFEQLLVKQAASGSDVVLGLFPTDRSEKVDMVDVEADGKIRRIVIKPKQTSLRFTWGIAVWTPAFTHYMHEYLKGRGATAAQQPELFVGDVIQAAIHDGLQIQSLQVSKEPFLDIGTPDDLVRALRDLASRGK